MGANPLVEANNLRKMWRELWWQMADGNSQQYNTIKGMDVFEFWTVYDLWLAKLKKNNKQKKQSKNGK